MSYPKTVLFTGAGANCPLDLPTTSQFFQRIDNDKIKVSEKELFYEIKSLKYVIDIEQVWYLLYQLENYNREFAESDLLNRFSRFYLNGANLTWDKFMPKVRSLKSDIEKNIFTVYSLNPSKIKMAVELYEPIITSINIANQMKAKNLSKYEVPIFTTNYDRTIEEVYHDTFAPEAWEFIDGFRHERGSNRMDITLFNKEPKQSNIKLFHLHGSLRWRGKGIYNEQENTQEIEKVVMEVPPTITTTHKEPIIIYPGSKKIDDRFPFSKLYKLFKDYLLNTQRCFIIGCSFRDIRLNNIFLEALKNNSKLHLYIISGEHTAENFDKVSKNEFKGIERYKKGVRLINSRFEDFDPSSLK